MEQVKEDIKYLLSFAPAVCPEQVVPDLFATAYITGSYEGDVKIAERINKICKTHNIDVDDIE